ncbi:TlyA family RNA methyltransferase [Piscinibacterium candidicorallinum]|uniref:TlyA family RNA methyltransferase n=1 Tax=Piscinibacterium candidicorallinum TaxID=1793872 RepID=A0ABV7HA14_9BURK
MRADKLLVVRGLVPSRTLAARLIESGQVEHELAGQWQAIRRVADELPDDAGLRLQQAAPELRYVSRGGLKLEGALSRTQLDVRGLHCLDLGQSTGGFTDCLLQRGAARVTGLDVGHGQLDARLRADPRAQAFEGINVRELPSSPFAAQVPQASMNLLVVDVSFISLALALPPVLPWLRSDAHVLALVKPQFEAGRAWIEKHGVVTAPEAHEAVRASIMQLCIAHKLEVRDYFYSPLLGGGHGNAQGNREFFVHAVMRTN